MMVILLKGISLVLEICFFDNASRASIKDFCKKEVWKLEFKDMKNNDLLPCPFCGSLNLHLCEFSCIYDFAVQCMRCKSNGPIILHPYNSEDKSFEELDRMAKEKAKDAWNKRK